MIRVKICGITNVEDALVSVQYGADAVGFIFYKPGKRYIEPDLAGHIIRQLPVFTDCVGVFVNENAEHINRVAEISGIHYIQLSGNEHPEIVSELTRPVIKALAPGPSFSMAEAERWAKNGAVLLLDSHVPGQFGGTGTKADWTICAEICQTIPSILAGGLTPDNVQAAIELVSPMAVDVSSGVEKSPGVKNHDKVKAFIKNAKNMSKPDQLHDRNYR